MARDQNVIERLAVQMPCPMCDAGIGQSCRSPSRKIVRIHSRRIAPLWEAYDTGYDSGLADGAVTEKVKAETAREKRIAAGQLW